MTHYVVKRRPETPNVEGETVAYSDLHRRIGELSGRPGIAGYILEALSRKERVYVAANRDSEWYANNDVSGFIVERIITRGRHEPTA